MRSSIDSIELGKKFLRLQLSVTSASRERPSRQLSRMADEDMLRCVWNELDYRIEICRVTKGSHTEHL
jgi:hypothetical protein